MARKSGNGVNTAPTPPLVMMPRYFMASLMMF